MKAENKGLQKRAKEFTLEVIKVFRMMPKTEESYVIGKQLLRAGTSVGANTRAAFRARSTKEFIAKTGIVIEEADECEFWLEIMVESGILSEKAVEKLKNEAGELVSIFVSVVNKVR